jgi:23S rRNA (cytidine1920-2'-O)/16S rRNA (cytidine1409-2'-O)-methyltransferase
MRLDQQLVDLGLAESREKAQRAILAGLVRINGHVADKPGRKIRTDDRLEMERGERYVSRGGFKLEAALTGFRLDVTGLRALDVGASTGGFTDCLLQHGAKSVAAVDVGRGQLAWKLRQDPRVQVLEETNARTLSALRFGDGFSPFDIAAIDCSFISLRLVLAPVSALIRARGTIVALVKPQFEAGREEADRGRGVISDPSIHTRVLAELRAFVEGLPGLQWSGEIESPLIGPAGNKEFLALLEKTS